MDVEIRMKPMRCFLQLFPIWHRALLRDTAWVSFPLVCKSNPDTSEPDPNEGMMTALFYLQFQLLKNRWWARLRRLKQPKYLLFAVVGGLYFYFYFFRWMFVGGTRARGLGGGADAESLALYASIGALILFVLVLLSWVVPRERAALAFSEAEVAFLFPAPISRRTLIHYKLLRSQIAIGFTTLFLTLLSNRAAAGGPGWMRVVGWWLILSTLNLHFLGASFARTLLLDRGISTWQRRSVVLALVAVLAGATVLWGRHTLVMPRLEDYDSVRRFLSYLRQSFDAGPPAYLLYPFRLVLRPYLARDAVAFFLALGPALGVLGLHYWWVVRSNVAFEEASVELSQKIADRIAAARAGRWQTGRKIKKPKRPPFELRPTGQPAMALLWKNLIAAGHLFTLRFWFFLLWLIFVASAFGATIVRESGLLPAVGFFCLMLLALSLLLGPQIVRQDFRQDLAAADILKLYPMRGWQLALGELLAPVVILTGVQWCLLVLSIGVSSRLSSETVIPLSTRLAVGFGLAVVLPVLDLVFLVIPNLAVLLLPSWFQSGKESPQGIEATGQRLIFMLGQLLVFCFSLIPAGLAFTAVFLPLKYLTGWVVAVPPASVAAAVVLAIEAALGLILLGRLFDRLDLSAESG